VTAPHSLVGALSAGQNIRLDLGLRIGILLLPLFHLTVKHWTNSWLAILGALSLIFLCAEWRNRGSFFENWWSKAVFACLLAPLLGVVSAQFLRHQWYPKAFDGPSRLALAAIVFLALRKKRIHFCEPFRWVCSISILISFLSVLHVTAPTEAWGGRFATYFVDCDTFGQHIVLLTFLSFLMVQMDGDVSRLHQLFHYIAVACGVYLAVGSQTRGAWIALMPMSIIWAIAVRAKPRKIFLTLLLSLVVFSLIFVIDKDFHARLTSIYSELHGWFSGENVDTSGGVRLTMWKVTWVLFQNNPLHGYGEYQDFKPFLEQPLVTSVASSLARETLVNGPHNQLAAESLRSGIFGVLYTLAYFTVPAIIFLRGARDSDLRIQKAATLGIAVIVAFGVFSLTMEVFNLKFAVSFFGYLVAALAADCLPSNCGTRAP
jgi:O-antigen ligase